MWKHISMLKDYFNCNHKRRTNMSKTIKCISHVHVQVSKSHSHSK